MAVYVWGIGLIPSLKIVGSKSWVLD